jgi:hypothetical protein
MEEPPRTRPRRRHMRTPEPSARSLAVPVAAGIAFVLAACSALGDLPRSSPVPPTVGPWGSPGPSATAGAVASAFATAGVVTGTIYPETSDPNATPTPTPSTTPYPTPQPPGIADAIYALIDQLGRPDWCDPDVYPVARADELTLAREHLEEMRSDPALFQTILDHNGMAAGQQLADTELVAVYEDWKVLTRAITLTPVPGAYTFDYIALRGPDGQQADFHVAGTVDANGEIAVTVNEPTLAPNCPICLARGTLIDAPGGPVPVEDLRVGVIVWTVDGSGARTVAAVLEIGSTPVPPTHEVVHLVLADGRTLDASPGHPLADGRVIGDVEPGDIVDGSTVLSASLVPYSGGATFDLLPAGTTGDYWANGVLIGSTLAHH